MTIIEELKNKITELQNKISEIQNQCSHPESSLEKEYKGITGNYDPSADSYWIEFHCQLCDKQWMEDQ